MYFTDPVLRAPTLGCMLMCLAASLVGVIVFLRKQSLLGESLSHASYPGVILAVVFYSVLFPNDLGGEWLAPCIMVGAFLSSVLGLWVINLLENRFGVRVDSALCLVLSVFFGVGVTLASRVQFTHTTLYIQIQSYLYGQAATMTDMHVVLYGGLSFFIVLVVFLLYKELQVINFDRDFALTVGIKANLIESLIFFLIVLAVIVGIRSVGVVLMSAMLIAPAAAARQYTNKLYKMFFLSAFFGVASGFFGVVISVEYSQYLKAFYPSWRVSLPTGPVIVLVASSICVLSLLIAPERGVLLRTWRIMKFRFQCLQENLLKTIWRFGEVKGVALSQLANLQSTSRYIVYFTLSRLIDQGWVVKIEGDMYQLTTDGQHRAAHIVRLHRLWEVYLASYLGFGVERVHKSAEEMEHIITPELEEKLTDLLHDPKRDPHFQPIPPRKATIP
ncbi:MAG: manganese/zinc/iron transport system permease protein [Chlamydiales bacterium]|jgi:manganese/zinc/iron transport system permease protein